MDAEKTGGIVRRFQGEKGGRDCMKREYGLPLRYFFVILAIMFGHDGRHLLYRPDGAVLC